MENGQYQNQRYAVVRAEGQHHSGSRHAMLELKFPTLCYLKDINEIGACRICVVEVKGARSLVAACVYPVTEGMEVITNTPSVFAVPQNHPGADPFHPRQEVPLLRAQRQLRAAEAVQGLRRGG